MSRLTKGSFGVQGVPGAGVVRVTHRVSIKDVVGIIGETFKTDGGPVLPAFRSMIVNHIENDLDPGPMQRIVISRNSSVIARGSRREL